MALLDRFGRLGRRFLGSRAAPKAWWETAEEFPPGADYGPMDFDPLGSYTGAPEDGGEPQQDADDL